MNAWASLEARPIMTSTSQTIRIAAMALEPPRIGRGSYRTNAAAGVGYGPAAAVNQP